MTSEAKSLQPILIFCAPRSCSTVVCAMLSQHPQLYGFPELNLFLTDTLGELEQLAMGATPGAVSYWTGLLRTLSELRFGGHSDDAIRSARGWVAARREWTTKRTFQWLLEAVHPQLGIDKSPRTCLSLRCMRRALTAFPQASVIQLTRHPVTTIRSLVQVHLAASPDKELLSRGCAGLANFYAGLWVQAQESIVTALQGRDVSLTTQVRAEDILTYPALHLERLADWLRLPTSPESTAAMLHPENSPYASLPQGPLAGDGDEGFQQSPALRLHKENQEHLQWPPDWNLEPELLSRLNTVARMQGYRTDPLQH